MTSSASPSFTPFKSPFSVFNSTGLFIAASLGIHALILWFLLPNLRSPSPSILNGGSQNVDLIELNEAEQSRLPDLSPQNFDLNDFNLPDVSGLDNTSSSLELDPSAIQSSLPSLPPPPPSLPPLNYNYRQAPPITLTPRSIPPITPRNIPIPPSAYRPSLPSPPSYQTNLPNLPNFPNQDNRPDFGELREPVPIDELINQKLYQPEFPQNPDQIAINSPNRSNIEENTPIQPQINPEQLEAQRIKEQRMRRLVAESLQGANSLRYDEENTSNDDAMQNNVAWMNKVGEVKPKSQSLAGNYPKAACLRQLEGTAVYGISVNPQGGISQPYLIQSSGYPVLNQQALRQIQASGLANNTGQVQPYRVTVNFQFDPKVCPSVSVVSPKPQVPTETPSQPTVTPQNRQPSAIQQAPKPQPVRPQPTRNNNNNNTAPEPSAIRQIPQPIEVQPAPSRENQPSAPSAVRKAPQSQPVEVRPAPSRENQPPAPSAVRKAPQSQPVEVRPAPSRENQPPAPSAVRKAPQSQPVEVRPAPSRENQPPAPSATRKAPQSQPIQVQPAPKPQNQPPAPSATRKAPQSQPIQVQPAPKPQNQPPAPSATRKAPKPQSQPIEVQAAPTEENQS